MVCGIYLNEFRTSHAASYSVLMRRLTPGSRLSLIGHEGGLSVIPSGAQRREESKTLSAQLDRQYYVYILTNSVRTLYVGVTNDLVRRVYEHKRKLVRGFTLKYNITWLAYYEQTSDIISAIAREKEIKGWRRSKKVTLIERSNPRWEDLSLGWYDDC